MEIVKFNHNHIEEAMGIAKENYDRERKQVSALPIIDNMPDLACFADFNLGVAAIDNGKILGYLCAYPPLDDAWRTTNAKGTFSPIHAHGVIGENRERVYDLLYQGAAKLWVKEGIVSHAIALYAHDKEAEKSFYYNGFGIRCIDAIRLVESIPVIGNQLDYEYCELPKDEWGNLLEMQNGLIAHLGNSPVFMPYPSLIKDEFVNGLGEEVRFFAAKKKGEYLAFIKISPEGENFICDVKGMMNISGAFCKVNYRGSGLSNNLLAYLIETLKKEGYRRLGVDCESFNPTARGFWLKHFTEYTNSVVRRIDEKSTLNTTNL